MWDGLEIWSSGQDNLVILFWFVLVCVLSSPPHTHKIFRLKLNYLKLLSTKLADLYNGGTEILRTQKSRKMFSVFQRKCTT